MVEEPSNSSPLAGYTRAFHLASVTTQKQWIDACTEEILVELPQMVQTVEKIKEKVKQVIQDTVLKQIRLGSSPR